MLKNEFMEMFYNVMKHNKNVFKNDLPAINFEFSCMLDNHERSGNISSNQAFKWYITVSDYAKIKRILNGN